MALDFTVKLFRGVVRPNPHPMCGDLSGGRIQCLLILFDVKASENIRFETKGSTQTEPSQGACYLSLPPRTGREHKPQAIP